MYTNTIKTPAEIEIIAKGGKILGQILDTVLSKAKAGVVTIELDRLAEKMIIEAGGVPSFKNYQSRPTDKPFPTTICASVNDELVHTPASEYVLKDGDILTVDIGMRFPAEDGLFTDMAKTIAIGEVPAETKKLLQVTKESLDKGIAAAKAGADLSDISKAVQQHVEAAGFSVVRDLVGHGVGYAVHEEPRVPNYYDKRYDGIKLEAGMVLAIEPMVNVGSPTITVKDDGMTIAAADGGLCAHFEHTIAVTKNGGRILTQ
jgi:methionyl aminopeptidase